MTKTLPFGRILTSHLRSATVAFRVGTNEIPPFGSLVRVSIGNRGQDEIFGLVTDIRMEEDGFLRQLASGPELSPEIVLDSRDNRNVPIVLSILWIGSSTNGRISHLTPPRPPLTLDELYICGEDEIVAFTSHGQFGYFRHLLRFSEGAVEELIAAHFQQAVQAHHALGDPNWETRALRELIDGFGANYDVLLNVFGALNDLDNLNEED